MDPASFAVGAALGILATCAGSTLIVWRLIHHAPRIETCWACRGAGAHGPSCPVPASREIPADAVINPYQVAAWRPTTSDERGPVTVYPPFTPPLIDTTATEDHDA